MLCPPLSATFLLLWGACSEFTPVAWAANALDFLDASAEKLSVLHPGDVEIELDAGILVGRQVGDVNAFKGIPFAKPPVGDLRWRPPQAAAPWRPSRLLTRDFRHNCLQSSSPDFMGWPQPPSTLSEDCLYLNVYVPKQPTRPRTPVMFWIHGGGYTGGGGNETRLNGTWDVAFSKGELIIVTVNYRLGAFGFLAANELRHRDPEGGTGNYGILDQRMALQWVQDNIDRFGGDPGHVFIVGQSAGANSVSQHLVRPRSWGLFSSAGLESGAFYQGWKEPQLFDKRHAYLKFTNAAGCAPDDVECLIQASAHDLLNASLAVDDWEPVIDGIDLASRGIELAMQGKLAPVPVLVGSVSEDGFAEAAPTCDPTACSREDFTTWATQMGSFDKDELKEFEDAYVDEIPIGNYTRWYWLMAHAGADQWSGCYARRAASWVVKAGQKAYLYRWSYAPHGPNGAFPKLAHHACEQPFVFHVLSETPAEAAESGGVYHIWSSEVGLSAAIVRYWMGMAARGRPEGDLEWPSFEAKHEIGLEILNSTGQMFRATAHLRSQQCHIWDKQFKKGLAQLVKETTFVV